MAAIVKNSIIDKIDPKREPSELYRKILEKQKKQIIEDNIQLLKHFDIENNPEGFVSVKKFTHFITSELTSCDYSPEEKKSLSEFIYYFCLDVPNKANILQYYYFIFNEENYYSAYIWGIPNNGRLGLSEDLLVKNEFDIKKENKSGESRFMQEVFEDEKSDDNKSIMFDEGAEGLAFGKNKIKRIMPTRIDFKIASINILKIACGHHHTMALDEQGIIYTWGMGSQGCLGNGILNDVPEPTAINNSLLKGTYAFDNEHDVKFKDISCGSYHSMALAISEDLYTWGANSRGQLGHNNTNNIMKPRKLIYFTEEKIGVISINAGDQHSAAISSNNELYTWGCGAYYRLGHGLAFDELSPKKVEVLEDVYVTQVSCGASHTLCITNEGFIYGWGNGMCGKLGIEEKCTKNYILPTRVGTYLGKFRRKQFQEVCAGPLHSLTLTEDGMIYTWGSSKNGILGLDRRSEDVYLPTKIPNVRFCHINLGKRIESTIKFLNIYYLQQFYQPDQILYKVNKEEVVEIKISALTCAVKNTFFLSQDGKLYCAGSNQFGLLARNPMKNEQLIIEHVQSLKNHAEKPSSDSPLISPGDSKSPTKSMVSGTNQKSLKEKLEKGYGPVLVSYFKKKIIYIACSYNHAMAINDAGRVYTWGANSDYQLGLGYPSKYEYIPNKLSGALETKIVKMCACSEKFSALLTDLGEVWTFGTSEQGSLGHEDKNSYIIPIPKMINDILPMIFIACGPEHMMAIDAKHNELYAWGNNIYGQLGIGPNISGKDMNGPSEKTAVDIKVYKPRRVPLVIGDNILKVEMVALGMYHSLILSSDRYLYSCGLKKYAGLQLSDLSQTWEFVDSFCPITAVRNKKFKMVACGEFHSLALCDSFDVYGWGNSLFGKLGEAFWREGGEILLEESEQRRNIAEDIKLIVPPSILFENKELNSNFQMKFVACGPTHSASINKHGFCYTWGSSISGKLGVRIEDYWKPDDDKDKDFKEDNKDGKKKQKKGGLVMHRTRVPFIEKKKNPEETPNNTSNSVIQRPLNVSGKNDRMSQMSKHSNIKTSKMGNASENEKNKAKDLKAMENINEKEEDEKENSDMLIREASSIESEDNLELEVIKPQLPRESQGMPSRSFQKDKLDTTKQDITKDLIRTSDISALKTDRDKKSVNVKDKLQYINAQDKLQKELFMEKGELKEERLMAEDNELEKNLRVMVERKLKIALNLTKEYNILLNRIDSVIYARMNIFNQNSKNIPFLRHIKHKVPTFILQNIQLYETVFSFLRLHPCYIMKIISTHLLNNSQVNQLINILYNNPISTQSSICSLISLSQMVFNFEVKNYFKITEIKNFKIGSIFWQIYLIMFLKQENNKLFLIGFAKSIICELFCKYYYTEEKLGDNYKDNDRNKVMQKALEFQEDDQQNPEGQNKNIALIKHLKKIIQEISKQFLEKINQASKSNKSFITKELAYLHSSIIEIYKKNELDKAKMNFADTNEFELVREEEQKRFENQLIPLSEKLDKNAEIFIRNLYFGVLIHLIQNYEQFDIQIPKDYQPFIEKSNNLKILSELIEKYFAHEVYNDEKKFKLINEFIINQNDSDNQLIYKRLTAYDYFNLTLNHLVETLTNDFDYQMIVYEVSLEFLFILHNLYCKTIRGLSENPDEKDEFLLRKREEDPIYIIFKYLNFEEIPINDYNSDTLRMNINLRTDPKLLLYSQISEVLNNNENFQFYRCLNCNILLPKNLLDKTHSDEINKLEKQGWKCKCDTENKINNFQCLSKTCNRVIPKETFNYLSIIDKFYQEQEPLLYSFLEVLLHMDVIKMGKNLVEEINENLERAKKKEDHYLVAHIQQFLISLEEISKIKKEDLKNKKRKEKLFNVECEKMREKGITLLKKRQSHRKYQIYLKDTLASLDLITREKMLTFRAAIEDLMKTEQSLLKGLLSDKKPNVYKIENDEIDMHQDQMKTMEYLNKQFNSFGVFTSSELFSNKTLRSCKFTNMEIPKILKHLKFYINSTDEGGFLIRVVYLNEHWLNIFIKCIKGYYFNEVTLQTVEISLEKYIELKRTGNFKAICTFGSDKVSATFNVFYLLKILRDIESQVLIQYNTKEK